MTQEAVELTGLLGPAMLFAFSMSVTPGPNNMMLTASGANFGFRRTVPHIMGITLGCMGLMAAVAMGLGAMFERWPAMQLALKVVGSVYLLWLAWRIATAPAPEVDCAAERRPLRLWQAAAFQFANPKAWIMSISGVASFTLAGDAFVASALVLIAVMALVNIPAISLWAGFGVALGRLLSTPRHWQRFNAVMGLLTAACVVMILV
ncbi:threonine/homoserine/homoserine lactone efflux protein [Marinobacterium sp. MBR-111]|jgi:threonine/homoserine/homoserine lactone efflux protein|uniref:LysE family translocator n=1 Tax=Marinobacterium sp. MBR-111 TaxID=3156463 RepID=UPI0033939E43